MKPRKIRGWDRKLWGVAFWTDQSLARKDYSFLLGEAWDNHMRVQSYDGEPPRILTFWTRRRAREWAKRKAAEIKRTNWHFQAVRVRETITPIAAKEKAT